MIPLLPNRQKKQLRAGAETALAFDMRTQLRTIKCGPTKLLFPAFTTANRGYMYRTIATLPKHHTRNTGSILHARINTPLKALRLNAQGKGGGGDIALVIATKHRIAAETLGSLRCSARENS